VETEAPPLISGGWQIGTGFAAVNPQSQSRRFYAVYEGAAFGHPERGIIALLARGHGADDEAKGANAAAQLVVHSFAEGILAPGERLEQNGRHIWR
jgi:hypothetical protein